jgi:hypothetical protein
MSLLWSSEDRGCGIYKYRAPDGAKIKRPNPGGKIDDNSKDQTHHLGNRA